VGIDAALLSKIFLPFFSTKEHGKGTGLGLSMVEGIIHRHQGFIDVSSTSGVGTRFSIYLPASDGAEAVPETADTSALPQGHGLVLVVDDEENMRMIACSMLEKCGYTVMSAADGEEGLALYRKHAHEVRAVLLDLVMPKLSGDLVYQAFRNINPGVKILLCSGYRQDTRVDKALNGGVGGFISKPYDLKKLAAAMRQLLKDDPGHKGAS
jgi:CheY-like chemotaxis protein